MSSHWWLMSGIALWALISGTQLRADDRAPEVMAAARAALGGSKLESVKGLSAAGAFRRVMGDRETDGELTVELALPSRIKRSEHVGIPGGPTFTRVSALNDGEFWTDSTNRGGGSFMTRVGPGADGRGPSEADRERFRRMQQQRLEREMERYLLVWLLQPPRGVVTYAGTAQAEDGTADVVEIAGDADGAAPMRLFLDQKTHVPLMLSYEDTMPRMLVRQRGSGRPPDSEEMRRRMAEPPQRVVFELRFDEYRDVDGVKLPHRISQSADGKPLEEWTIEKFQVNPSFKANGFAKP